MARILAFIVIALVVYILVAMYRHRLRQAYTKPRRTDNQSSEHVSFVVYGYTETQMQQIVHAFLDESSVEGAFVQTHQSGDNRCTVTMPAEIKPSFEKFVAAFKLQ